jgi:hypothetical protein
MNSTPSTPPVGETSIGFQRDPNCPSRVTVDGLRPPFFREEGADVANPKHSNMSCSPSTPPVGELPLGLSSDDPSPSRVTVDGTQRAHSLTLACGGGGSTHSRE